MAQGVWQEIEQLYQKFQQLGISEAVDLTAEHTQCFASKGEMRKLTQGGGVSINKEKLSAFDRAISTDDLLDNKYLLVQQGKKKYFLLIAK